MSCFTFGAPTSFWARRASARSNPQAQPGSSSRNVAIASIWRVALALISASHSHALTSTPTHSILRLCHMVARVDLDSVVRVLQLHMGAEAVQACKANT